MSPSVSVGCEVQILSCASGNCSAAIQSSRRHRIMTPTTGPLTMTLMCPVGELSAASGHSVMTKTLKLSRVRGRDVSAAPTRGTVQCFFERNPVLVHTRDRQSDIVGRHYRPNNVKSMTDNVGRRCRPISLSALVVFTPLHGMQMRSSDENSVCPPPQWGSKM